MTEEKPTQDTPELTEEAKFKSKFPNKKPTTTDFLRKRLHKGVKYFDSGDYNMAKSAEKKKGSEKPLPPRGNVSVSGEDIDIGEGIPTPDKIPHRKQSVPSKLVENQPQSQVQVTL